MIVDGRVGNIFYCSEEHRNETMLSLSCEDNGEILIDDRGITFLGKFKSIEFHNITGIELVENTSRKLGAWIQIRYTNGGEQELVANIIKLDDEVLMGRKKENTSELYRELLSYMNRWKNS